MKSHEFINAAADLLGSFGDVVQKQEQPVQPNRAVLTQVEPELDDNTDKKTMVGPLQQKLELLKKAVDVDNMYDNPDVPGYGNNEVHADNDTDLSDMKRLAGIMFNAEEDSDGLEG